MTILQIVQRASLYLGLEVPSVFYTNPTRTWQEMQVVVSDCVTEVVQAYDWQKLKKVATINGDGITEDFAMPADYDHMVRDAHMWTNFMTFWPGVQVGSVDTWLAMEEVGFFATPVPLWIIFNDEFHVRPVMGVGDRLSYFYISDYVVSDTGSPQGVASEFTADTQSFLLPEDLLRLCIVYNWKKLKGLDYAADLQSYQEYRDDLIGSDKGPRIITEGRGQRIGWFGAWPFAGTWR